MPRVEFSWQLHGNFIVSFNENALKPNTHQGLSSLARSVDFQGCYENYEKSVYSRIGFVKKSIQSDSFSKLNASGKSSLRLAKSLRGAKMLFSRKKVMEH